ncbi:major facilitator superfamily domain-containing protein [Aspergillus karnatakaensis]|uniref:major facilitator superfamily domain-containing protein n=1 Tax=Aspergillus karnatakaensis TaxID=1810916 RepID=UPI003CCE4D27
MPAQSSLQGPQIDERSPLLIPPSSSDPHVENAVVSAGADEADTNAHKDPNQSVAGTIAVLLIGVFVANAEGSLVLATYGRISSEFNDLKNASWLVTSYVLAMTAAQPIYGKLSDIFGRTKMILVAYLFFALGCVISGMAGSLLAVVVGRVVSGIGGGGMGSLVSIIVTDLVPAREVGVWRSYVAIIATAGRGLGGPIGGYLADTVGWRWSFIGQCPPTLLAMLLTWTLIPNITPLTHSMENGNVRSKLARIDFAGAILLASATLVFLLPLELAGNAIPWTHPLVYSLPVLAVATTLLFFFVEQYWAKEPIFAPKLLKSWDVIIPNTINFCQAAAQLGMMYTVPIYFQIIQSASSTVSGAKLFPAVVGVTIGGLFGGYMTKRTGRYKLLLTAATLCSSSSYLLLTLSWDTDVGFWKSLFIVPGGLGNGLILSAAFTALTAGVEKDDMATVCSSFYLAANTGTVLGLAVTNAVLQGTVRHGLEVGLRGQPERDSIIENSILSIEYIQTLPEQVKGVVVGAYVQGFRHAHASNLVFSSLAFLATLPLKVKKI